MKQTNICFSNFLGKTVIYCKKMNNWATLMTKFPNKKTLSNLDTYSKIKIIKWDLGQLSRGNILEETKWLIVTYYTLIKCWIWSHFVQPYSFFAITHEHLKLIHAFAFRRHHAVPQIRMFGNILNCLINCSNWAV